VGLSRSFLIVGAGLGAIGVGSLGFLAIVSRSLDDDAFARFGVWFGLVNVVSFGLFVPLETAVARAMLSSGTYTSRMRRETVRYTAAVLIAVLGLTVALRSIVLPRLMAGSWALVAITLAYLTLLALQAIQRGMAVGRNQFWPLFYQFGTDGVLRLLLPGLVVVLGVASTQTFALSIVASATCGLIGGQLTLMRAGAGREQRDMPTGIELRSLAALVTAALGAQLLANGAPPILSLIDRDNSDVLVGVVGALALTRMPLLFASAIQAPLLPPMVRLIEAGDTSALWRMLRKILTAFAVLGVGAWFAGWYLGALLLRTYLGDDYGASPTSMALLTTAGVALLAVVAVQASIVAVGAHNVLAASWGLGIAVFLGAMAVPASGLVLAPVAIALGTGVTLVALLFGLRATTHHQRA
jgi:O-antigen/teichoic acid export membrane protein